MPAAIIAALLHLLTALYHVQFGHNSGCHWVYATHQAYTHAVIALDYVCKR